jgi:hypothetical protein
MVRSSVTPAETRCDGAGRPLQSRSAAGRDGKEAPTPVQDLANAPFLSPGPRVGGDGSQEVGECLSIKANPDGALSQCRGPQCSAARSRNGPRLNADPRPLRPQSLGFHRMVGLGLIIDKYSHYSVDTSSAANPV